MAFIVETGAGTPGANAYAPVSFVTAYLTERGRQFENGWKSSGLTLQQARIIQATDYIETTWGPRFKGSRFNRTLPGRQASGLLTLSTLPIDGETLTIGIKVYRLVDALAEENDVLIGSDVLSTIANLVDAIDALAGAGVTVEEHTLPNPSATAISQSTNELAAVALVEGESGNSIAFSTTITGATITGTGFFEDGIDAGEQPLSFPRNYLYSRDGTPIYGIPLKVKQAMAEYAVRAANATLSPDPVVDERLVGLTEYSSKVGPIEESFKYASGTQAKLLVPYPAADRLLAEFVTMGASAIR